MANPNRTPPITVASAIHNIQLHLLDTPSTPFDLLIAASTLLSKPDYDDVVSERNISDLCGYPLCPKPLPSPDDRRRKGKYRVSLSEHKVYDLQETYSYCSEECLIGSRALKGSLSDDRRAGVDVRKGKIEEVLRLFGCLEREEDGEVEKVGSLVEMKLEIKEKEGVRTGDVRMDEWIGPSNAIEGYIPHFEQGSKFTSNLESMQGIDTAKSTALDYTTVTVEDKIDGALSKESSATSNDISEVIAQKLEDVVITENKETNDVSEIIAEKLEDMVITEKKETKKGSSKSSKRRTQPDVSNNSIDKVYNSDAGFTSSIIFGNEFVAALPKTCDASELIAKQLEDVVITEKSATKAKTSKSPKTKSRKKTSASKSDELNFQSSVTIGDSVNAVAPGTSSVSFLGSGEQSTKESEDDVHIKNKTETIINIESDDVMCWEGANFMKKVVSQKTGFKSSLKTLRSKGGNRSVKWADERNNEALEDRKGIPQLLQEDDLDISLRRASAEACAAALSLAAEAVASGEADAGDAVSKAGVVILTQPQYGDVGDSEADEEAFKIDRGVLKWPKKTVLLDSDVFDVEDSWHDMPPEGFSLALSSFATMWMALFEWITCSSLAYIYGRNESLHEDFLSVNGREYLQKEFLRDGKSSEIRQALDGFICRTLPGLVMDLRLPTPVSTLEKFMVRLLDTMSFVDALPSFKLKQWQVVVLLFIEALSVHRLPSLAPQMTSRSMLLHKVLNAAQVTSEEYETMRGLIMPLGSLPQFSMQSGGYTDLSQKKAS